MTASSPPSGIGKLTPLQRELLAAFFRHDAELFLTGGGALAGYWLGHRPTDDLDLFGLPGVDLERAVRALYLAVDETGGKVEPMQSYPDFRRLLVTRGAETCKIDFAVDRAPALDPDKPRFGDVRVDSAREIAANKVCALVGRSEIRDLVDLRALLEAGHDLAKAIADAQTKDGGADAATLAWLLDQLVIGPEARIPGEVDPVSLARFRDDLVVRLRALAAVETR